MSNLLPQFIVLGAITVILVIILRRLPQVTVKEEDSTAGRAEAPIPLAARLSLLYQRIQKSLKAFFRFVGNYVTEAKDYTSKAHYLEKFSHVLRLKRLRSQLSAYGRARHGHARVEEVTYDKQTLEQQEKAFIKIIEHDPTNQEAYEGLGKLYLDQHKHQDASEVYEYLAKLHPDKDAYFSTLGLVYFNLNSFDKAIAAYKKAVELRPDGTNRLVNLSLCYEAKGELRLALETAEKAVAVVPENTQFLHLLADLLKKDKQTDRAEEILEKILELEPTDHSAREKLTALKY